MYVFAILRQSGAELHNDVLIGNRFSNCETDMVYVRIRRENQFSIATSVYAMEPHSQISFIRICP